MPTIRVSKGYGWSCGTFRATLRCGLHGSARTHDREITARDGTRTGTFSKIRGGGGEEEKKEKLIVNAVLRITRTDVGVREAPRDKSQIRFYSDR